MKKIRDYIQQLQTQYQLSDWYIDVQTTDDMYVMVDRWHYYEDDRIAILRINLQFPMQILEDAISYRMKEMAMRYMIVQTERLYLRHTAKEDYEAEWILQSNPNVALTDGYAPITNPQDLARKLQQMINDPGCYSICLLDGTVIGHMSLRFVQRACVAMEIGYAIQEAYWNQGYGFEAANAIVDKCFSYLHVDMVIASHFEGNIASQRIMEKLGMQYEGCMRKSYRHDLYGAMDLCTYSILKEEWIKK